MKYKVIIELDENRTDCSACPCMNSNDECQLQDLGETETWEEQLSSCPLKPLENVRGRSRDAEI